MTNLTKTRETIRELPENLIYVDDAGLVQAANLKALEARLTKLETAAAKAVYDLRSDVSKEKRHAIVASLLDVLDVNEYNLPLGPEAALKE